MSAAGMHATVDVAPVASAPPADARPAAVRTRLIVLAALAIGMIALYQFWHVQGPRDYVMNLRFRQVAALVVVGVSTGVATTMFQTVAGSRILTPSVMGFDTMFVFVQTLFVYFLGPELFDLDQRLRFLIDMAVMSTFAVALLGAIIRRNSRDLFVLVLVGIVLASLFGSLATFASRLLSPSDYLTLQDLTFVSFNTVNADLLAITALVTALGVSAAVPLLRRLDVVALGRDSAVALGLPYRRTVNLTLSVVTVLVASATALVGPMAFVGLIVANLARQVLPTHRHRELVVGAALWGVLFTVGGQFVVARVLGFTTTLTVVVNLVGGVYFVWLLLREATL